MGKSPHGKGTRLGKPLRKRQHVDLLRSTDTPGHGRRRRDPGGHHQPVSFAYRVGCTQKLDVRNIRCPPGGCGRVDVAFRTAMSGRPCAGSAMSACAAVEQKGLMGFGDRLVHRFCRGLFGAAGKNIS